MKKITHIITLVFFSSFYITAFSQLSNEYKALCFEWSVPVKVDNGWGEIEEATLYWTSFFGNYKNMTEKYSDYRGRGDYSMQIYHYENGNYVAIDKQDMFNENLPKLLETINKEFKSTFLEYFKEDPECYKEEKFEPYTMNDLEIYFTKNNIQFSVSRFGREYNICETADNYELVYTWKEILPYLKDQETSTPNVCTPSGPKVNIRSEESVKSSVLFQLDRGEFFEILETGKKDQVNGKDGNWYMIKYKEKTGYIFSFYTLCK